MYKDLFSHRVINQSKYLSPELSLSLDRYLIDVVAKSFAIFHQF